MLSDELELLLMKRKIVLIYLSIVGWIGLAVGLLTPLVIFSNADDELSQPFMVPIWVGGGALAVFMGIFMLLYRRKKLSKIGLFFVIVGSMCLVAAGYYYFEIQNDPEPSIMAQPANAGAIGN